MISGIEWPAEEEAVSEHAMAAVEQLLTMDPNTRPTAKEVREMKFFETIDFNSLETEEPPFIPNLDDPHDTGYFEGMLIISRLMIFGIIYNNFSTFISARNTMQHLKLSNYDSENY